jgi:hypothetical protein
MHVTSVAVGSYITQMFYFTSLFLDAKYKYKRMNGRKEPYILVLGAYEHACAAEAFGGGVGAEGGCGGGGREEEGEEEAEEIGVELGGGARMGNGGRRQRRLSSWGV